MDARAKNLAGGVYGTILATSLIAAFSEDEEAGSGDILVSVLLTVAVFWAAHVYADVLGRSAGGHRSVGRAEVIASIRHEWPLVEAAVVPCLALALGALGPLGDDASFDLALALGVVSMAAWGLVAARAAGARPAVTVATTVASTGLGLVIVALKVLVE